MQSSRMLQPQENARSKRRCRCVGLSAFVTPKGYQNVAQEPVGFESRSKRDNGHLGADKARSAKENIAWVCVGLRKNFLVAGLFCKKVGDG